MKYKVGDRVKHERWGKGTIRYIDNFMNPYAVEFDERFMVGHTCRGYCKDKHGLWCNEDELELVPQEFTKSDLQDGDIVTYRNKRKAIFVRNMFTEIGSREDIGNNYDKNLNATVQREFDIVKVERPIKYKTVFDRKEEILDEAEKRYLSGVIRPWRDEVKSIKKSSFKNEEYIYIELKTNEGIGLPNFKKGTMYDGMEIGKYYTLEELGL